MNDKLIRYFHDIAFISEDYGRTFRLIEAIPGKVAKEKGYYICDLDEMLELSVALNNSAV